LRAILNQKKTFTGIKTSSLLIQSCNRCIKYAGRSKMQTNTILNYIINTSRNCKNDFPVVFFAANRTLS
jgi:hypothetical protein